MSWYAFLLLFLLSFSSVSLQCSLDQFSLAFFVHLLMFLFPSLYFSDPSSSNLRILLFSSLYFSDPSGLNLFFLSYLLLSHRSSISAVTRLLLLTLFSKGLTGCFSYCCAEGGYHRVHVCIFIIHDDERCKLLPPVIALKVSNAPDLSAFQRQT